MSYAGTILNNNTIFSPYNVWSWRTFHRAPQVGGSVQNYSLCLGYLGHGRCRYIKQKIMIMIIKNVLRQVNARWIVCIIQDKQTTGIIYKANTLCMDNHILLQSHGELLSVSLFVCLSLSLYVAVRLSLCISDKKLLNKGINTVKYC